MIDKIPQAGALQVNERSTPSESDDWCYLAGTYSESTTSVSLLDSQDPTKGMKITYTGDACGNGNKRKFHIDLQCDNRLNAIPTHALELSPCEYTVTIPSVFGCPLECPISNRQLCGGNGHCGYDDDKRGAKCFCNHGYKGLDCMSSDATSAPKLNYSPALLGLIITIFIIIMLLIGAIVVMIKQLSAYKDDISHYQALKGGDEEHAHV